MRKILKIADLPQQKQKKIHSEQVTKDLKSRYTGMPVNSISDEDAMSWIKHRMYCEINNDT